MRRIFTLTFACTLLAGAAGTLLSPIQVKAQGPGWQGGPGCCVDMWNPDWMQRDMWGQGRMGPGMRHRMARHWTYMHQGLPAAYDGARNPLKADAETIGEGRTLYQTHCASCHGKTGMGDGDAGKALNPSPALLAYMIQMPVSVDEYMLWTVSEGGKEFGTEMPAFKDTLEKDEIWRIVLYMRAGFPDAKKQQ